MADQNFNLEMIDFFKQEANAHILKVNNLLLAIEKDGGNTGNFSKIKSEMHTLKGDARMMGLMSISGAAHKVEDLFEILIKSNKFDDKNLIKNLFKALDAIQNATDSLPESLVEIDLSFVFPDQETEPVENKQDVILFEEKEIEKQIDKVFDKKEKKVEEPEIVIENKIEGQTEKIAGVKANENEEKVKKESLQEVKTEYLNINILKIDELIALSGEFVRYYGRFNYILNKMIQVSGEIEEKQNSEDEGILKSLENLIYDFSKNLAFFDLTSRQFQNEITNLKLVPLSTIFDLFPRLVRDIAETTKKEINFIIEGKDVELDKIIVEKLKTILIHILRNAIDHGCETPEIRGKIGKPKEAHVILKAVNRGDNVEIEVSDDGGGLDIEKIRAKAIQKGMVQEKKAFSMTDDEIISYIFEPGFSTKEVGAFSGRGIGMDIVATTVKELNGEVKVRTVKNKGTSFTIILPLISSFIPITTILLNNTLFGIPSSYIKLVQRAKADDIKMSGDKQKIVTINNTDISIVDLQAMLGLGFEDFGKNKNIIIVKYQDEISGFIVTDILQEKKMVIKQITGVADKCSSVIGAVIGDMRIIPVLNIPELFRVLKTGNINISKVKDDRENERRIWVKNVLLVEDSALTRNLEKKILLNQNLNVFEAANGKEAVDLLNSKHFDLIITDIEMPVMNGIELVNYVKERDEFSGIPIVIVSSYKTYEEKISGLGVNHFISKGDFTTQRLMDILMFEKIL